MILFLGSIVQILLNAVTAGLIWETGIKHGVNGNSIPYSSLVYVALALTMLCQQFDVPDETDYDKDRRRITTDILQPIICFIIIGAIYLLNGGYKP